MSRLESGGVGIVGGGLLGMTLALGLARRGHRVTILEAGPDVGGLAQAASIGSYTWDRFYHVILLSDRHLLGLLEELGLGGALRWKSARTGFYTDGRLHSLSGPLEFLTFPPLSLPDKARLVATILRAARITDAESLEAVTAVDWLRRWSGDRTVERIWLPLLRAKLGDNWRLASAAFIQAIIARMYAARRAGLARELFGYVEGGYAVILRRLRERLEAEGVVVCASMPVHEVRAEPDRVSVRAGRSGNLAFDHAVLTVSCSRAAAICADLAPAERRRLEAVVYQGVVCASLLLRRPLSPFYITNITDAWVPFTGVIEYTALLDRAALGGHSLVYLPRYLPQGDAFWNRTDDEVREEFLPALARMHPDFRPADLVAFSVSRAREVQAVPTLRYSAELLPPTRTSLPRVFLANSAQIVNGTLNVNETVALANAKAAELAPLLRAAPAGVGV